MYIHVGLCWVKFMYCDCNMSDQMHKDWGYWLIDGRTDDTAHGDLISSHQSLYVLCEWTESQKTRPETSREHLDMIQGSTLDRLSGYVFSCRGSLFSSCVYCSSVSVGARSGWMAFGLLSHQLGIVEDQATLIFGGFETFLSSINELFRLLTSWHDNQRLVLCKTYVHDLQKYLSWIDYEMPSQSVRQWWWAGLRHFP